MLSVFKVESAARGTDETADDATSSPPFGGKCRENRPSAWYQLPMILLSYWAAYNLCLAGTF
jgi:hypothetical protein